MSCFSSVLRVLLSAEQLDLRCCSKKESNEVKIRTRHLNLVKSALCPLESRRQLLCTRATHFFTRMRSPTPVFPGQEYPPTHVSPGHEFPPPRDASLFRHLDDIAAFLHPDYGGTSFPSYWIPPPPVSPSPGHATSAHSHLTAPAPLPIVFARRDFLSDHVLSSIAPELRCARSPVRFRCRPPDVK